MKAHALMTQLLKNRGRAVGRADTVCSLITTLLVSMSVTPIDRKSVVSRCVRSYCRRVRCDNNIKNSTSRCQIIRIHFQISDAVLDAHLAQDPDAKVACGRRLTSASEPQLL